MAAPVVEAEHTIVADTEVIDTPTMVVDESILHQNIAEMAALAKSMGVNLRPHIKTHKTPQIAKLQLAAGAVGITCAKLGEAEVMVDSGITDILMAYATVGELKIRRLLKLMDRAKMTVALDSREAAQALSDAMAAEDRVLDVYVEINTGLNRAGVLPGDEAVALAVEFAKMPGLHVVGIMTHEGQTHRLPVDQLEQAAIEVGKTMVATAEAIRAQGIDLPIVSVGSTPAARFTPTVPGVTEMRPGTYVFKDASAFQRGFFGPDRCAARILTTVISHAAANRSVLDAGSKTLSLDKISGHAGHGYIVGHPDAIIDRLSEEHGVVEYAPGTTGFNVGDRVEVIPNHVCPTVNLMEDLTIVRDGHVIDVWPVAARAKIR